MASQNKFTRQLENFGNEAESAAKFLYSYMTIQYAASVSKDLLTKLNKFPRFWLTNAAACQAATYICLGRIFDTKSEFNIHCLLNSFEANLPAFSKDALATRKRDGKDEDPEWLADYIAKAYYPTTKDVDRLRKAVARYNEIYTRAIKPARNKYFAHKEKAEKEKVEALFANGQITELWHLVTFLHAFHMALWNLYHNGHKPSLRKGRYSVKSMFNNPSHGSAPHENIVADTKMLMKFIETAPINSSLQR